MARGKNQGRDPRTYALVLGALWLGLILGRIMSPQTVVTQEVLSHSKPPNLQTSKPPNLQTSKPPNLRVSESLPDVQDFLPLNLPPEIKTVYINIGSHLQPMKPPDDDPSVAVLSFEPIMHSHKNYPKHPRLFTFSAAVSNRTYMTLMRSYNEGKSSSLSEAMNGWKPEYKPTVVLDAKMLVDSIPEDVNIRYLKTDIQGYDFTVIEGMGDSLKRIDYIEAETHFHNAQMYAGAGNDFCRNWLPYMQKMGYQIAYSGLTGVTAKEAAKYCKWDLEKYPDTVNTMAERDVYWTTTRRPLQPRPLVYYVDFPFVRGLGCQGPPEQLDLSDAEFEVASAKEDWKCPDVPPNSQFNTWYWVPPIGRL